MITYSKGCLDHHVRLSKVSAVNCGLWGLWFAIFVNWWMKKNVGVTNAQKRERGEDYGCQRVWYGDGGRGAAAMGGIRREEVFK